MKVSPHATAPFTRITVRKDGELVFEGWQVDCEGAAADWPEIGDAIIGWLREQFARNEARATREHIVAKNY